MPRRIFILLLSAVILLTGCSAGGEEEIRGITVVTREAGSGTRSAFTELFGIMRNSPEGVRTDYTTDMAEETNSTAVMMTTVSVNRSAIGYISLGAMNDDIKAVKIDGAEASADNIRNGSYKVFRPFCIVTAGERNERIRDFLAFVYSAEGQAVVEREGYITVSSQGSYSASGISGQLTISGSSSVSPLMEKLKEEYEMFNPDIRIELQQNDSTTGINSVIDGICDIGMSSRALKISEEQKDVVSVAFALDGIAVIVNKDNPVEDLSTTDIQEIYTGERTEW